MHRASIQYPDAARAKRVQGVVTVEATIDASGNVVDTRVLSGPVELRRAAQQSVLKWHFAMDTLHEHAHGQGEFRVARAVGAVRRAAGPRRCRWTRPAAPPSRRSCAPCAPRWSYRHGRRRTQPRASKPWRKCSNCRATANLLQSQLGPPSLEGKRVGRIFIGGLSDQSRSELMSHLQIHVGDTLERRFVSQSTRRNACSSTNT